ncbi:MAG: hypothetical protein BEN19_09155 [Epulopiscium sp. Nuni2H_MBin003]|nr:MAG: hypothetical protein BEN19_09155 [Epulopiscium sp. Nuni2H_MBin003]
MGREIISFDYAMKYILRQKSNFDILEGFLSDLLGEDIIINEILESEGNQDRDDAKLNRVDLIAKDSKGTKLIIEIQYNRENDYLERILWETSKAIVESLDKADPYEKIVKVISINILYFNLGKGEGYVYKGATNFKDIGTPESQKPLKLARNIFPEYYLINVERFKNVINTPLDEWIYMFRNSKVPESPKAKHMDKVQEKLDILKMSSQEKKAYEYHLKETKIYKSVLKSKRDEGKAEGRLEGRLEGKAEALLEMARKLLAKGMDFEFISETTGLSIEEIEKLKVGK